MREPLSDEEVGRIARATAREVARRLLELALIVALTVAAVSVMPALVVMTVNSVAPPLGRTADLPMGAFFAFTFVVLAVVLVRSWARLRR